MAACSSSQGLAEQCCALLYVTATGSEGTAWSCGRGGAAGSVVSSLNVLSLTCFIQLTYTA